LKQEKRALLVSTTSRLKSAKALAFYGRLFEFKLRGKSSTSAFIDLGDQFLALQKGRTQPADDGRHFGLVVDDKDAVRKALADAGIQPLRGPFLALPGYRGFT
jgi:lactoylglutathione lyase